MSVSKNGLSHLSWFVAVGTLLVANCAAPPQQSPGYVVVPAAPPQPMPTMAAPSYYNADQFALRSFHFRDIIGNGTRVWDIYVYSDRCDSHIVDDSKKLTSDFQLSYPSGDSKLYRFNMMQDVDGKNTTINEINNAVTIDYAPPDPAKVQEVESWVGQMDVYCSDLRKNPKPSGPRPQVPSF